MCLSAPELIDSRYQRIEWSFHSSFSFLTFFLSSSSSFPSSSQVDAFVEYAAVVFGRFADRVPLWITFNEPHTFIRQGYSEGVMAPGRCSDRTRCTEGDSFTEPYLVR